MIKTEKLIPMIEIADTFLFDNWNTFIFIKDIPIFNTTKEIGNI